MLVTVRERMPGSRIAYGDNVSIMASRAQRLRLPVVQPSAQIRHPLCG